MTIVTIKGRNSLSRNKYKNLKSIENISILNSGDLIQQADEKSTVDFVFIQWKQNPDGTRYAECREEDSAKIRSFYPDSIKKSERQIRKEKKELKKTKNVKTRNRYK